MSSEFIGEKKPLLGFAKTFFFFFPPPPPPLYMENFLGNMVSTSCAPIWPPTQTEWVGTCLVNSLYDVSTQYAKHYQLNISNVIKLVIKIAAKYKPLS